MQERRIISCWRWRGRIACLLAAMVLSGATAAQDKHRNTGALQGALQDSQRNTAASGYFANVTLSPAWQQYLARSKADLLLLQQAEQAELQRSQQPALRPASKAKNFGLDSIQTAAELAAVLSYQTVLGGFSKRTDMRKPRETGMLAGSEAAYIPTFDNGATTSQIRWLVAYYPKATAVERAQLTAALLKALDYLLRAQYPNGGFPQSYPLRGGYHDAVTLNDNVLSDILQLLWDVATQPEFALIDAPRRQLARTAFGRGVDWLLAAQVQQAGRRTVWSAQHHPLTAEPVAARKFEQVSLVSSESAAVLKLLLDTVPAQAGVLPALCGGVDWLRTHQIRDKSWQRSSSGSALVDKPGALLWARFYSLDSGEPVFFDRDGQVYRQVGQLSLERQQGYAWYQSNAKNLLKAWSKQPALQAQCEALTGAASGAAGADEVAKVAVPHNLLPLGQWRTADPSAHVWPDGRLWLYTSHDQECQQDFHMKDWLAFSSGDGKHWQQHGIVFSTSKLSWADDYAWAPDAAYRNGKYYLVFPAGSGVKNRSEPAKSTKWMGIGVAVSDNPHGPFRDAIGGPLWREPYANDPALFIDDDQTPWLYFHGKNADYQVVRLNDSLTATVGDFMQMDMGGVTPKMEGPWVFKRNGLYYFTMPENNRDLSYYTATSPTGPWQYQGIFMPRRSEQNNHHSIVEFQGQWWLFYHLWLQPGDAGAVAVTKSACQRPQRQVAAIPLQFDRQGRILPLPPSIQ